MLAWPCSVPHEWHLSYLLNKHHFKPHLNPLFLGERLSACTWGQLQVQQLEWDQEPWDPCVSGAVLRVSSHQWSWSWTSQGVGDMAWEQGGQQASEVKTKGGWRDKKGPREFFVWASWSVTTTELGLWPQGLASPSASIGAYCVHVCSLCACNLSVQDLCRCVNTWCVGVCPLCAGNVCSAWMPREPGARNCSRLSSPWLLDPASPNSNHCHCHDTSRYRWEMISISVSPTSLPWQKRPRKEGKGEHSYKPQDAVAAVSISHESVWSVDSIVPLPFLSPLFASHQSPLLWRENV